MSQEDTVSVLNDLIQTSEDGKKGFADAAEHVQLSNLKTVFEARSLDCAAAAIELQSLVGSLGGVPRDSGTLAGAARRGWASVRASLGSSDRTILDEVESAEDVAKAAYAKALTVDLPGSIRSVIERQSAGAVRNHDLIRSLRDAQPFA